MAMGKYYCDYCDKEFKDTPGARKRHLQGVYHQRAKALWYDSLRYGNQVPDPESIGKKGVCNRFVRTGSCQYGNSCKYYHPKQNVQNIAAQRTPGLVDGKKNCTHSVQSLGRSYVGMRFLLLWGRGRSLPPMFNHNFFQADKYLNQLLCQVMYWVIV